MHVQNLPVEIFALILKLLDSRDLLQCATVCSQWKDTALDVKWKEHKVELVDMFRVLGPIEPSSADRKVFNFTTKHSSIEDALASAGWKRLNELRKKVTRLRITKHLALSDIKYLMSLQHAIKAAEQPFCPNLRRLDFKIAPQSQPDAYDFLTGQSLIKIKMRWTPRDYGPLRVMVGAVERVALRSPMVEHIDVSLSDSHFIDYGRFSRLRTLIHEGDFSMKSLSQLCTRCPLLEVARLWWMEAAMVDDETAYSEPQEMQVFPALQDLNIADSEYGVPSLLILRSTKMPQLRELEADLGEQGFSETNMLLEHIRRQSPLLETLTVTAERLEWGNLASFTGLRVLELLGYVNSFTTEHVARIIGNIPNLARLSISSDSSVYDIIDRSRVAFTPAFLESIAKQCHHLSDLELPLDTLTISWTSEPPNPACKFEHLKALALNPLHIVPSAMEPVAKYLSQLFPSVETFETVLLHPDEPGTVFTGTLTEEEISNTAEMERLFFDVKNENGTLESVPE